MNSVLNLLTAHSLFYDNKQPLQEGRGSRRAEGTALAEIILGFFLLKVCNLAQEAVEFDLSETLAVDESRFVVHDKVAFKSQRAKALTLVILQAFSYQKANTPSSKKTASSICKRELRRDK